MSTGVEVSPQCLEAYHSLKQQGAKKTAKKYIIFALNQKLTEIVVEKESDNPNYEEFLENLPENEPRYAVYDVEYEADGGGQRNKLVFIAWVPTLSKVRQRMVYAGSKEALKNSFDGISAEVQATDLSEVEYNVVVDKLKRSSK